MNPISPDALEVYWSPGFMEANLAIALNLLGAFLLGLLMGYERAYRGRAAGMRTFALVSMASASLTVIAGYPAFWFGGQGLASTVDPTRVVQGIVTGIGFLGAGVIMKEGFNISGLTTAASIWSSSVVGVLVGSGFYAAAVFMAVATMSCTSLVSHLEHTLPQRAMLAFTIRFRRGYTPPENLILRLARERGYHVLWQSLSIRMIAGEAEWQFMAEALDKRSAMPLSTLAKELAQFKGVAEFNVAHTRN